MTLNGLKIHRNILLTVHPKQVDPPSLNQVVYNKKLRHAVLLINKYTGSKKDKSGILTIVQAASIFVLNDLVFEPTTQL